MDVSILGCLDVGQGAHNVVPTAAKPKVLLGVLAVRADEVVGVNTLLEELWGQRPPGSATTTLQTYVLQIRNLIAGLPELRGRRDEAKQVLAHTAGGYKLNTEGGFVDAVEFARQAEAGRKALAARDCPTASERFRDALKLWRSAPLVDVEPGPLLGTEVSRLQAERVEALADLAESDLRLGRHHWWVGDLAALTARHPTHERLQALYMLALLGVGRRDRALEVYTRLHNTLRRELGTAPSPTCQQVQALVLGGGPDESTLLDQLSA